MFYRNSLKFFAGIVLLTGFIFTPVLVQSREFAEQPPKLPIDGWNLNVETGHDNPYFWEFKYFNFIDSKAGLSGNISFFTVSPRLFKVFGVSAHFYLNGKVFSYQKVFPLSCILASPDSPALKLCDDKTGGIVTTPNGDREIILATEKMFFKLHFHPTLTNSEIYTCPLDGMLWGSPAWMKWRPVFIQAEVAGTVTLPWESGKVSFNIKTNHGYHDQNWGIWKPGIHPYRWMHFTGHDQGGKSVTVMLGDFYGTKTPGVLHTVLIVQKENSKTLYTNEQVHVIETEKNSVDVIRFGVFDRDTLKLGDTNFVAKPKAHEIPSRFTIQTVDNAVNLTAETVINDSTGAKFPVTAMMGDFYINEQIVKIRGSLTLPNQPTNIFSGLGEVQFVNQ